MNSGLTASFEQVSLPIAESFTIARGSRDVAEYVVVRVSDGEVTGIGGAAPSARYGETAATVCAVLPQYLSIVEDVGDPAQLMRIAREMNAEIRRNSAARCAVSIALHDLVGKQLGVPLVEYWGLDPMKQVESSYTIGIDTIDRMVAKTEAARTAGYGTLKVKLGTDRDRAIIEAVREAAPDATIRVDANEGWSPREAVTMIEVLEEHNVEFVEQPVPASDRSGLKFVYDRSALPIAVDESCVALGDVPAVADRADIVNLKLMKCGGIRSVFRMVHAARAHNLDVMLGCMIESNASIAAACQFAPILDYADLDGSLLLESDPFRGIPMPNGVISLVDLDRAGSGAVETEPVEPESR